MSIHTYSRKVFAAIQSRAIVSNLLVLTLLTAGAAWCNISLVTSTSAQAANDTLSWAQIGSDQTAVQASFNVQTAGNRTVGVTLTGPNSIASVVCTASPCSWTGAGFPASGDTLLWTSDAGNGGTGPVTLTFSAPVSGAGAYVQSDMPGGFTAVATAYNGQNQLGSVSIISGSGNAIYVGLTDSNGFEITSVVFSITSCGNGCNTADFAIDKVGLNVNTLTQPTILLSQNNINFGNQTVGSSSAPTPVTLTNTGGQTLNMSITPSGDYSESNNCGSSLSGSGGQCTINITFTPTQSGTRTGSVTVSGNATNSPQSVTLTGVGVAPQALQFVPVTPCRIADTRSGQGFSGQFGPPELGNQSTRNFTVGGQCGIPANALAYSLNATVVPDGQLAYLTVWPAGVPQPTVSTLNSDGRIKANAAVVPAGANGQISVFAYNSTNFILDTDGYFITAGTSGALAFYPLTPCRIVDTRSGQGFGGQFGPPFISGNSSRAFPINPKSGTSDGCSSTIPTNAQAYSLNFTAIPVNGNPLIYVTVWPTGQSQPTVSTLNATTGTIVANAAIVPGNGNNGSVSVFASNDTDLAIDINGYFAAPGSGGLSLYTLTPCRVLDTRGPSFNQPPFSGTLPVSVVGSSCSVPASAQGYVLNATVVPPSQLVFLSLWPHPQGQPVVSTLNALDGAVTANMAVVPNIDGITNAFASNSTQLILDISSYFAP